MKLSSGAKRELLILFFVKAIFQTAYERNLVGTIPVERSNKIRKVNAKADSSIKSLSDRIVATIDLTIDVDNSDWLRSKTKGVLFTCLQRIAKHKVQLETFAFYLMYVNFCESKKPLHVVFEEYNNASLYFDTVDLLKMTNVTDDLEADMMNLAYSVIAELKG